MTLSHLARAVSAAVVGLALIAPTTFGCTTPTTMTDQWKDPSYAAGPMKKIVVMGLRLPPEKRRVVEDEVVADLRKQGVQATTWYQVFGDTIPPKEQARATLQNAGYDGVLVLRLERVTDRPEYVSGGDFWGAPYGSFWGAPMDDGYVVNDETVSFGTSLWSVADGKRVWSASTETDNPSSSKDFADSLSDELVPALEKQGLVATSD